MFWRFCLYGFLKNQRYFEPFLVLAFLDWGLSFFTIGVLVAVREFTTNALEILSGALADTWGRRRAMVLSFASYLVSFVIFAMGRDPVTLGVAMALYGVGDAFRSGTHKAMILTWLREQGRADEKTQVYGVTRSWSKLGAAVGVGVGAIWVIATGDLDALFWMAMAPYALGLLNLATYPASLDGERASASATPRDAAHHLMQTAREVWRSGRIRRLLAESSGFMGSFKASKDYLQPVLEAAAVVWLVGVGQGDELAQAAWLIGPVYGGLNIFSAWASRRSGALVERAGDHERASTWIWTALVGVWALALAGALASWHVVLILAFVALHLLESLWRPVILSRFDDSSEDHRGATLLSVESQARSLTTMVLAPTLGALVDWAAGAGVSEWSPVAGVCLAIALVGAAASRAWARVTR